MLASAFSSCIELIELEQGAPTAAPVLGHYTRVFAGALLSPMPVLTASLALLLVLSLSRATSCDFKFEYPVLFCARCNVQVSTSEC